MSTLLSTKLYMPQPQRELIGRSHLIKRLETGLRQNHGFGRKLTLLSAPPGYGKTTLVSDWLARSQIPTAWLSLDASDNDLARFFSYLIAALQGINPSIGADIRPILEMGTGFTVEIEPLLTALVNDVEAYTVDTGILRPAQDDLRQTRDDLRQAQDGPRQAQDDLRPAQDGPRRAQDDLRAAPVETPGHSFVLVLDDYHVIREFKIHQALDFFLDHIPPRMHIVIMSRTDPPMPLGRLRVQRQLTELREADLRFTLDEATVFLNDLMGLDLTAKDIENLEGRTEGWIAGLQLTALSLQGRSDRHDQVVAIAGSHRHLIDYLVEEVMSRLTPKVQEFLLYTSLLDRFNASLCDAVCFGEGKTATAGAASRELLVTLEIANLFLIPLDDRRQWYRYHHLFADFLRQRLHETQPEIVPELYRRASQWYEVEGMVNEAIEHALAAGDANRAARLLDENIEAYVFNANIIEVQRWANRLPVHARARFPRLCLYHAWALQFEYRFEAVEPALALAEAHLATRGGLPAAEHPASLSACDITGHAATVRAYTALTGAEYERAVKLSLAALDALPEENTDTEPPADVQPPVNQTRVLRGALKLALGIAYHRTGQTEAAYQNLQSALPLNQQVGNRFAALSCIVYLMVLDIACGALNRALANGDTGLLWIEEWARAEGGERRPARVLAHLRRQMAEVYYERNDLEQAAACLYKATDHYDLVGSWLRVEAYAALVDLHWALRDGDKALDYLRTLKRINLTPGLSLADIPLATRIAQCCLLLSQSLPDQKDLFADAVAWAERSGLRPDDEFRPEQEYEYLTLARVLIAQGSAKQAFPLLDRLIASAAGAGRNGHLIAYLSLQALAYHAEERTDAALRFLSRALALGEPEGYVRSFVDLGPPMRDLLQIATRNGSASTYVARLLDAFPEPEVDALSVPSNQQELRAFDDLVEPLNEREMQILRLLAVRLSYREIAQELYLSLNTIKWYAKNIYGKLGVNKRDLAVSRARELDLL